MDVTTTQMTWKPPLLKLTQVALPDMIDQPTALFVDGQAITKISQARPMHTLLDGSKLKGDICTLVECCHFQCWVAESPEMVARMRDEALGHKEPHLRAV